MLLRPCRTTPYVAAQADTLPRQLGLRRVAGASTRHLFSTRFASEFAKVNVFLVRRNKREY